VPNFVKIHLGISILQRVEFWHFPEELGVAVTIQPVIETFLISFEKIARLNKFPPDKYTAILQAHLTGKVLKIFTDISIKECQDYSTLKKALLAAFAVVPKVYGKRFRASAKSNSEMYCEFAFRLSTQFRRW